MNRAITARDVHRAWYDLVAAPRSGNRETITRFDLLVLTACMIELPSHRPSTPEVAEIIGCSHTTVLDRMARWSNLHWRDRMMWLCYIEKGVADEVGR